MATYTTRTGIELDERDPDDRKILARERAAAREAGTRGDDRGRTTYGRADLEAAFDAGAQEAPAAAGQIAGGTDKDAKGSSGAPERPWRGRGTPRKGRGVRLLPRWAAKGVAVGARDGAGFLVGAVLHALVVSYIRYGTDGPKGWLSAKFLNKPIQGEDTAGGGRRGGGTLDVDPDVI